MNKISLEYEAQKRLEESLRRIETAKDIPLEELEEVENGSLSVANSNSQ